MYDELIKRLRGVAEEVANDYDVDPYNAEQRCFVIEQAAYAIEVLQKRLSRAEFRLCDWCGVCPDDKRDIEDCEIAMIGNEYTSVKWATCQPEPPKEET